MSGALSTCYAACALLVWRFCSSFGRCLLWGLVLSRGVQSAQCTGSALLLCGAFSGLGRRLLFSWAVWRRLIVTPSHHRLIVPWSHRLTVSSCHRLTVSASHRPILSSSRRLIVGMRGGVPCFCPGARSTPSRGAAAMSSPRALETRAAVVSAISSPGIRGPPPGGAAVPFAARRSPPETGRHRGPQGLVERSPLGAHRTGRTARGWSGRGRSERVRRVGLVGGLAARRGALVVVGPHAIRICHVPVVRLLVLPRKQGVLLFVG